MQMPDQSAQGILDQLQPIFQEVLEQPNLAVTRSSSALSTPNWDSLSHIELIEAVQSHFKVKFGLGELQDLKNVGDLVDLILEKKS
jgi:acyl carrier protein